MIFFVVSTVIIAVFIFIITFIICVLYLHNDATIANPRNPTRSDNTRNPTTRSDNMIVFLENETITTELQSTRKCPICAETEPDDFVICNKCKIYVHADCWELNLNTCPAFGCRCTNHSVTKTIKNVGSKIIFGDESWRKIDELSKKKKIKIDDKPLFEEIFNALAKFFHYLTNL